MKKFLLGLLTGISAGILFAPENGKKLRGKLKKSEAKLSDFFKALTATGKDASDEVKKIIESKELRDFVQSKRDNVDDFFNIVEKKGKNLGGKAKQELNALLEKAAKKIKKTNTEEKK